MLDLHSNYLDNEMKADFNSLCYTIVNSYCCHVLAHKSFFTIPLDNTTLQGKWQSENETGNLFGYSVYKIVQYLRLGSY